MLNDWMVKLSVLAIIVLETSLIVAVRAALQEEEEGFKMAPSNFVPTVSESSEKYASKFML